MASSSISVGNLDDDLSISSSLRNLTEDDSDELSAGTSLPKGVKRIENEAKTSTPLTGGPGGGQTGGPPSLDGGTVVVRPDVQVRGTVVVRGGRHTSVDVVAIRLRGKARVTELGAIHVHNEAVGGVQNDLNSLDPAIYLDGD
ncbi:hypothetical protein Tco_1122603 [Tanacetum coccineum]|uniref:Polymer-forming cytoskeletal protein n=1 Tax=Tanacetum coccineum TaxID=301880 RepID=A0ABQ5J108_9ASTR